MDVLQQLSAHGVQYAPSMAATAVMVQLEERGPILMQRNYGGWVMYTLCSAEWDLV